MLQAAGLQEMKTVLFNKLLTRRSLPAFSTCLIVILGLCGCTEKQDASSEPLARGLRVYKVAAKAESRVRRFPSILQPAALSRLSFEIPGQLKAIDLEAGQKVKLGELLAEIDPRSLQTQVEQASAGVRQAEAKLTNAESDFGRQDALLKQGYATRAVWDVSNATLLTARAQLDQAKRQFDLANHGLERSKLLAPFTGAIAGVEVKSFAQVAPGQPIVTLYSDESFEMSFLVPSATFQSLKLAQSVEVKVPDRPDLTLTGQIKELGSKAEQVSGFPVVVRLENSAPGLNAGMSVEIALEEPLIGGISGFLVPLSVLAPEGGRDLQGVGIVFLYDATRSAVKKQKISVGGIRDNQLVVTEGLNTGDLVASAGVSYLVEDQKVKLLPLPE
jgi:RND family efflux transporter MFP subunit